MTASRYDVLGIGNAIVDVIAQIDDQFLVQNQVTRGAMTLIDDERAEQLYAAMPAGLEMSGGCAGNTVAGVASLGGRAAYIGKVRNDQLGAVFTHDIRAGDIEFTTSPAMMGPPTARCLILVTPDGERSMSTFLGACTTLSTDDIDAELVGASAVTYLEGYLFDPPAAQQAFYEAARIAHKAGRKVALTLSDSFCVDRHRAAFRDLVEGHVDILFANEHEIASLYETSFDEAAAIVRTKCDLACLTRGAKGSLILSPAEAVTVPAAPVDKVVDTTGAGDLYAAGFLYGWATGRSPAQAGRIGSIAAGTIIAQVGARPQRRLADLI
ncbi:MAG: putative carbohydrate/purine kinase [Rhodospirillales bacterium]|nr:putative carbohydrate/purine kinase [Rhodospirillales bacterium]